MDIEDLERVNELAERHYEIENMLHNLESPEDGELNIRAHWPDDTWKAGPTINTKISEAPLLLDYVKKTLKDELDAVNRELTELGVAWKQDYSSS